MRQLFNRLAAMVLAAIATAATAQDYAREQRWAAEVVPNVVVGDAVQIAAPGGRTYLGLYAAASAASGAVLLVHGIGVHPDHGVIGVLRVALNDAGYATLSIQMPVQAADATAKEYYPSLFPEAAGRIGAAMEWLVAKGHARPVLLSHSMGSWMSEFYLSRAKDTPARAWVCLGRSGAFADAASLRVPVLDVLGSADLDQVKSSAAARKSALSNRDGSRQAVIEGANHFYTGREQALIDVIRAFLTKTARP